MKGVVIIGPIPDHIRVGLDILFVGYNPSILSGERGHHYANPHNRFWQILYKAGLTPSKYKPQDDQTLLELGYGLTNIVARPTRSAAEISKEEYAKGRLLLIRKIALHRPKVVCFVGKGVYEEYSGRPRSPWGVQDYPVLPGIMDFVAPSSSGLVRMKMDEVVRIFSQLKTLF